MATNPELADLIRLACVERGWGPSDLARAVGVAESGDPARVHRANARRWITGTRTPDYWWPHVAQVLGLDPEIRGTRTDTLGVQASDPEDDTKRRNALKIAGLTVLDPASVAAVLDRAADEVAEFTRQAEATALGTGTLEHLDFAITGFNEAYSLKPPHVVFDAVMDYRRKVDALLRGPHTHCQERELLACAGWLSELLAWLAHDLGDARVGLAFATDAYTHAEQAGHGELCGWAMDAAASISLYEHRPDKARHAAERGLTQAPTTHPLSVRLHAQSARAAAADGNHDGFTVSFNQAQDAYQLLPPRPPRRFGMPTLPLADYALTSYPASAHIWLGNAEQAQRAAESALAIYRTAPAATRSPSREAIARIDLALSRALLGDPDDALALGHQALDSTRVVDSVRKRAHDLADFLTRRYPRMDAARGLTERLTAQPQLIRGGAP
ncbi:tetratricopeptide repeat protein [Streptomyces sp. BPTC-684]|uniref:tetratricopeptide repeat protein n=1 Tax=Streptomyces sp. BPTC-684 TaxID=3043734 RepID=UPI0024B1DF5E|nr:tetratricopeptide repeat protein [Streptomyces sp. BPTC-684]WHM36885.1 tetratricopeptide repeat protein [Streptomyces sp. BPTC-684]